MKLEQHKNVFYKNIGTYMALINNELKKEYPLEPLSNHIKMVGGYAFKSSHYLSEGVPVIRISDFQNEKIELTGVKYYEESDDLDRYELIAGDVIIAMTGGTIGKLAIVQEGLGKLYLNQRVGKFQVLNSNEFEDEYVYWLARGIQDIVQNLGYGGAQPNVSNKQIEALEFSFPEREIQKQIIAFLNDLKGNKINGKYFNTNVESKIINLQNTSVKLNTIKNDAVLNEIFIIKLKKSILQEAIQGKLTANWRKSNLNIEDASILLERIKEEKTKLIKDKKIRKEKALAPITKEEIPFDLPKGWVWCRLQDLEYLLGDGIHGTPEYTINGEYHFINGNNLSDGIIEIKTNTKTVSKEEFLKHKRILNDRTILVSINGTIGNTAFYNNEKVMLGKSACYFNLLSEIDKEYIRQLIKSKYFLDYAFSSATQMTIKNVSLRTMRSFIVPLPPLLEQKAIVQKVNVLMGLCDSLEQELKLSQAQNEQFMQSIMRESLKVDTTF